MCSDQPSSWASWLSLAEWWYNTNYHTSIHTTPFEVVYGQPPPIHLPYLPGEATTEALARTLTAREAAIQLLKFHLYRAQNRMSQQANKRRSDRHFEIGDFVYLKLQPYKQSSMRNQSFNKLLPKFYGPYQVTDQIGSAAYKLNLPTTTEIHNVFHVSQLKPCHDAVSSPFYPIPVNSAQENSQKEPEAILDRKMVKRGRMAATKVLVKWKDLPLDRATWEFYYDLLKKFPNFHP